jgi:hypothetical protein
MRRNRARGVIGVAAIPAVAAIPGQPAVPASSPPDLLWWSLVPLSSLYDSSSALPLAEFWRRSMAAPDRSSVAARSDPSSRVQAISSILYRHLGSILNDRKASHAQRARAMLHSGEQLLRRLYLRLSVREFSSLPPLSPSLLLPLSTTCTRAQQRPRCGAHAAGAVSE